MKFRFRKEVREKKTRWYVYNDRPAQPHDHGDQIRPARFSYYDIQPRITAICAEAGFKIYKDNFNHKKYGDVYLYTYFRSNAEEARFMLWASGGVDVDF
jgi:hypothetical protein